MTDLEKKFINARKMAIAAQYKHLNNKQVEGVMTTEGPLLLLAGAGSGKTTVLINRIANLLRYGRGSDSNEITIPISEDEVEFLEEYAKNPQQETAELMRYLCAVEPARPWEVLAITFTNKAANELKERLSRMLGEEGDEVWASTFHSACVRILRRDIDKIGFSTSFTIYDTDDCKRVIKDSLKELQLDEKTFPVREILSKISKAKDKMISAADYIEDAENDSDWRNGRIGKVYKLYSDKMRNANALDFDDIILYTVQLLQSSREAREYYQRKFRYVLIDEYQDTNHLQYLLAKLLSGGRNNICVVGDDDQSIYRFRGANIENILSFENEYQGARTIRLEQNYRSTKYILEAANEVIRHNQGRKGKTLWTDNCEGEKLTIKTAFNESDEADFVAGQIMMNYRRGISWKDHAILYRMNAQSNALEYAFKRNGMPYKIIGGMKFFDRAEIKDMLAYLCVINNTDDDLRLRRIVNVPSRKIGAATIDRAQMFATAEATSLFEIMRKADTYPELKSAASRLKAFTEMIDKMREQVSAMGLIEFYDYVCETSGYTTALIAKNDMESRGRLENIEELKSSIVGYMENADEDPSLFGFLDEIALYTDLDSQNDSDDCVTMMTMHTAKGLEYPYVFVVGMEDGLFPSNMSMGDAEEIEEERRLCYVAMTRAKEKLFLTNARQRMLYGRTTPGMPSRFLEEIPEQTYDWLGKVTKSVPAEEDFFYDGEVRYGGYSQRGYRGSDSYGSFGGGYSTAKNQSAKSELQKMRGGVTNTTPMLELKPGESVVHDSFGMGMVLSVRKMGNDALTEIAFDQVGTKKLMLKAASAHLKKQ